MKKIFILTLIGVFGFILVGCGNRVPQGVSSEVFEIGSHGLEIVDQYLNNDLNRNIAVSQLDTLLDQMSDVIDDLFDEDNTEDDEDVEWALIVVTDAVDDGLANSNAEEMQTRRDALAKILGKD